MFKFYDYSGLTLHMRYHQKNLGDNGGFSSHLGSSQLTILAGMRMAAGKPPVCMTKPQLLYHHLSMASVVTMS